MDLFGSTNLQSRRSDKSTISPKAALFPQLYRSVSSPPDAHPSTVLLAHAPRLAASTLARPAPRRLSSEQGSGIPACPSWRRAAPPPVGAALSLLPRPGPAGCAASRSRSATAVTAAPYPSPRRRRSLPSAARPRALLPPLIRRRSRGCPSPLPAPAPALPPRFPSCQCAGSAAAPRPSPRRPPPPAATGTEPGCGWRGRGWGRDSSAGRGDGRGPAPWRSLRGPPARGAVAAGPSVPRGRALGTHCRV